MSTSTAKPLTDLPLVVMLERRSPWPRLGRPMPFEQGVAGPSLQEGVQAEVIDFPAAAVEGGSLLQLQDDCATNLSMIGTIRTKEKCPQCGGPFQKARQSLECRRCRTKPNRYFIDFPWRGQRLKIYTDQRNYPLSDYEQANRLLHVMRDEVDRGAFDLRKYVHQALKPLQFDNYATAWIGRQSRRAEQGHITWEYFRKLRGYVHNHLIPSLGRYNVRDLQEGQIEDFWLELPSRLTLKTRHHILAALHKIMADALRRKDIGRIPDFPEYDLPETAIKVLDVETQERILAQIKCPIRHAFFLFLMRTGCRHNEARALQWKRVDLQHGVATIAAGMDGGIYKDTTKEKNVREVPLTEDLVEVLEELPAPFKKTNFVFTLNGRPLTTNMVWRTWTEACRAVGVEISPYQGTRHSLATQLLNEGVSEKHIQALLGHKTRDMMDRYAKMQISTLKSVLQARCPRTVPKTKYNDEK
jgi:integrase